MSAIDKVGLEFEGGWAGTQGKRPFADVRIKHDGSVRFEAVINGQFVHSGEIASDPMDPEKVEKWIKDHCPTHANDSAGTHMHISFVNEPTYGSILTPSFQKTLIKKYIDYNEKNIKPIDEETYLRFKTRLEGRNRYCTKPFRAMSQIPATSRGSDRYAQLNYCYMLHGTLEIRVLPCTTNKQALVDLWKITRDTIETWVAREMPITKVRFRRQ